MEELEKYLSDLKKRVNQKKAKAEVQHHRIPSMNTATELGRLAGILEMIDVCLVRIEREKQRGLI